MIPDGPLGNEPHDQANFTRDPSRARPESCLQFSLLRLVCPSDGAKWKLLMMSVVKFTGVLALGGCLAALAEDVSRLAEPAAASKTARVSIALTADDGGWPVVTPEQQPRLDALSFQRGESRVSLDGVTMRLDPDTRALTFTTHGREVVLTSALFPDFAAKIADQSQAVVHLDALRHFLTLEAAKQNSQPVTVRLSDGSRAEIAPAASAALDVFTDGSFTFSAQGEVYAITADGQPLHLSAHSPPLSGGPLQTVAGRDGTRRWDRLRPVTEVTLAGNLEHEVRVRLGGEAFRLVENETRHVTLPNGSAADFEFRGADHLLAWTVTKGDFRLAVTGFSGWKAIALTGQSGAVQWDAETRVIDLHNPGSGRPLLVTLPGQNFARLDAHAVFQFAPLSPASFATAAAGGPVSLYNALTKQETPLERANLLFKAGQPVLARSATLPAITLAWQTSAPLELTGTLGRFVVAPGADQTIAAGGNAKLDVHYEATGRVTLKATVGDYQLQLQEPRHWSLALPAGEEITFERQSGHGQLTAVAAAGNTTVLELVTAGEFSPRLSPNARVTFWLGPENSLLASASGTLAFYEAAGAGTEGALAFVPPLRLPPRPGTTPVAFGKQDDHFDVSQIHAPVEATNEPAVSFVPDSRPSLTLGGTPPRTVQPFSQIAAPRILQPPATGF